MKLQWSDRALGDLESLLEYIAMDNPDAARRLHDRVFIRTDRLVAFPDFGPVSREAGQPIREVRVKPLRILYLHEENTVTILAVYREEASLGPERAPKA